MREEDMRPLLADWEKALSDAAGQLAALSSLIGSSPEAPLQNAVGCVMAAYTKALAEMIGFDYDTLEAWWLDSRFGERPIHAGFVGEPLRQISNTGELADYIAECHRRGLA